MKFSNAESNEVSGTSFHGQTITASLRQLKIAFGRYDGNCDKSYCTWVLRCEGTVSSFGKTKTYEHVFTIYDSLAMFYPENSPEQRIVWHIGSFEPLPTPVLRAIMDKIARL